MPQAVTSGVAQVIASIPDEIPVLLDAKRGDIGSTSVAYADAVFMSPRITGVTLNAYMGWDSVEPFVTGAHSDKGVFILCKTSNPSSSDLQEVAIGGSNEKMYELVARTAQEYERRAGEAAPPSSASSSRIGLVVGATDPIALARVRKANPTAWLLTPGVGAQVCCGQDGSSRALCSLP